jgi:hypothetical protein
MIEPLRYRVLRKLKQFFCLHRKKHTWINGKFENCERCDKQWEVKGSAG